MKTVRQLFEEGSSRLKAAGIENGRQEAGYLLEDLCGIDRIRLYTHPEETVDPKGERRFNEAIRRRLTREPLQYILGKAHFMGMVFHVSPAVLIPRQDTEVLVETALAHIKDKNADVLDMCTGSGCILLSLMALAGLRRGCGADISPEALEVAALNQVALGIKGARWILSALFEKVTGKYDMILSNTPYIPRGEIDGLMPEVSRFEPRVALDGQEDGLAFYREIVKQAPLFLKPGGMLFFEIGCGQAADVTACMAGRGFEDIHTVRDLSGLDRVVYGRIPSFAEERTCLTD